MPTRFSINLCAITDRPILQLGSQGPFVKELKDLLLNSAIIDAGIAGFNITDHFNEKTEFVVKVFQCQVFLKPDGIVGIKTWKALCADRPIDLPTLSRGDRDVLISQVQHRLSLNGYPGGAIDGQFGAKTEAAIRAFQTDKRLIIDGIVGYQTWKALSILFGGCELSS